MTRVYLCYAKILYTMFTKYSIIFSIFYSISVTNYIITEFFFLFSSPSTFLKGIPGCSSAPQMSQVCPNIIHSWFIIRELIDNLLLRKLLRILSVLLTALVFW